MTERNLDFDRIINRKNTDCLKYDFAVKRGMPSDVLPLWVADMDFETSSYIEDALVERVKMGIYGYSDAQTPYFEAVAGWMKRHHNWQPKEKWLIKTPGVVFALAIKIIVMIMGLFGGTVFPLAMGLASDAIGQSGAVAVMTVGVLYLLYYTLKIKK